MNARQTVARALVATLTLSAAGFATWKANEGDGPTAVRPDGVVVHHPYVPTQGDVPTIGHGSTRYEDGTPVRMADQAITSQRAKELARNLHREEEARFIASLPGVALSQKEFDLYLDFVGQYGIGNWRSSSMRRLLMTGQHRQACQALLQWRFQAGRDCREPKNWGPQGCKGVWTRQQQRHADCMGVQP